MDSIQSQQQGSEVGMEVMESIALSDPAKPEFIETSQMVDIRNNCHVETDNVGLVGKAKRILAVLRAKMSDIVIMIENQWLTYCTGGQMERTRVYNVWPGNNVFFFGGRLICGPDPRGLLLTAVSIGLSSWIFCAYVADDLPQHSGLVIAFSTIITVIVLINLIMVSMFDPGIIPRKEQSVSEEVGTSNRSTRKKRTILVNGLEVKLKYCHICKIYRPPRSCHCAICDNCVEKFDHHCPWIGQCIGLRNYRFYLTLLGTALIFFVYIFGFSCWRIQQRMSQSGIGLFGLLRNRPELLALASFSLAATGFLGALASYHVYLTVINQTAYENFRERYVGSKNPYDKGILSNIKEVLLFPLPPPRVDFRAEVAPYCWSVIMQ